MKVLSTIFFILAGLCVAYFGVIIGYGGIHTSFCFVWIAFAVIFVAMGVFIQTGERHKGGMPRFIPTFIYTTFGIGLLSFAMIMNLVIANAKTSEDKKVDYCIVMGARVYSNGISRTLMYRLDEAFDVFLEHPGTKLVLAGGQAVGDAIPEAFAMYNYLSMKGIPNAFLMMEPKEVSTVGIIRGAVRLIDKDLEVRKTPLGPGDYVLKADYVPRVGIITSDYHMFRSMIIAKENGIEDPVSLPSQSDDVLFVHNCVRESAAIIKDFIMGNVTIDEQHMPEVPFNREADNR